MNMPTLSKKNLIKAGLIAVAAAFIVKGVQVSVIDTINLVNFKLDTYAITRVNQRNLIEHKTVTIKETVPVITTADLKSLLK